LFTGKTDIAWLHILRPGFRHCLVLLPAEGGWIGLDPRSNRTDVFALPPYKPGELAAWLRSEGYRVLTAELPSQDPSGGAPIAISSCVESVKRCLGINRRRIFTPWHLYVYLLKEKKRKNGKEAFMARKVRAT
jgi:hypothetical protein